MNQVIGKRVKVLTSLDPTQRGLSGEVLLETSRTFLLEHDGKRLTIQKRGTVLQVQGEKGVISGDENLGRLEERIERSSR